MIFTCPSCGLAYAVPETFAGLICGCRMTVRLLSPASTPAGDDASHRSPRAMDGGRGSGTGASVSTESRSEKPSTERPKGSGKPAGAQGSAVGERTPELDAKVVTKDEEAQAEAFFKERFFAKKGTKANQALSDEWRTFQDAAAAFGFDWKSGSEQSPKYTWRDWFKERWDLKAGATDKTRAVVIKALILAGVVKQAPHPTIEGEAKKVFDWLLARLPIGYTLATIQADVSPKADQALLDKLLDLGMVHEDPAHAGEYLAVSRPKEG